MKCSIAQHGTGNLLLKKILLLISIFLVVLTWGCKDDENNIEVVELNAFADTRDGTVYSYVRIEDQTWMSENLKYDPPSGNTWCYENDPDNCDTFGRLYDWNTAMNACPDGWHLPTDEEWEDLITFLGGEAVAGGKMKSMGTAFWIAPNTDATNESGFSALPGGVRRHADGVFLDLYEKAYWWSSTESSPSIIWDRSIAYYGGSVFHSPRDEASGHCVRCIKD